MNDEEELTQQQPPSEKTDEQEAWPSTSQMDISKEKENMESDEESVQKKMERLKITA